MRYAFHPEAEIEFVKAVEYYVLKQDIRRSLVRRFPYAILYSAAMDGLFVLAVMHLHREPDYWKNRA